VLSTTRAAAIRFKEKLARGERVLVVNPDHPSPSLVEFLGVLPLDAVFIDCEQGSADVETVENMARAARAANLTSLVRLFSAEDWVIERYLGRGVDGIVVPRLDAPEQAARIVEAVRYCCPATHSDKSIVVQIESRAAVERLGDFLHVEGIDVFFVGPVDLAKSLGHAGDFRHPEVHAVICGVIADIRRAGRVAGILVDGQNLRDWARRGVQFLYAHANHFLAHGAEEFAARLLSEAVQSQRDGRPPLRSKERAS
jgi:4-hydroxy-2-oxoheptanedioate aldolase